MQNSRESGQNGVLLDDEGVIGMDGELGVGTGDWRQVAGANEGTNAEEGEELA